MKLLITGGCGYNSFDSATLKDGHDIINIDTQWFGNHLKDHKNLINIKQDVRNIDYQF